MIERRKFIPFRFWFALMAIALAFAAFMEVLDLFL